MLVFVTDKPYRIGNLIKQIVVEVGIYLLTYLGFHFLYPEKLDKFPFWQTSSILIIINFIRTISTERVYEIGFNDENKQIVFFSKKLFLQPESIFLLYDVAKLQVDVNRSINPFSTISLLFLKSKKEILKVSKHKDGFSPEQLKQICVAAASIHLPIEYL
jgi:hypothetical protein